MTYTLVRIDSQNIAPDLAIVAAARASFQGDLKGEEKDRRLLERLVQDQHTSPLEVVDLLFRYYYGEGEDSLCDLTADSRFQVTVVRGARSALIRVDAHNAMKIVSYYPNHPFAWAIENEFKEHLPWLYKAARWGISNPGTVVYPQSTAPLLQQPVLDGWIELLGCPTDGLLTDIANEVQPVFNHEIKLKPPAQQQIQIEIMHERNPHSHTTRKADKRPLGLLSIQFRLRAPVVVWWQLVRHRSNSFSMQSGRYVEFSEGDFTRPDQWRLQSASNKQGSDGHAVETVQEKLNQMLIAHQRESQRLYEYALEQGIAREQARIFLPAWASLYTGVVKMDLLHFEHFLGLRMASDAQYEIRMYANAMWDLWASAMPITAWAFKRENDQ